MPPADRRDRTGKAGDAGLVDSVPTEITMGTRGKREREISVIAFDMFLPIRPKYRLWLKPRHVS